METGCRETRVSGNQRVLREAPQLEGAGGEPDVSGGPRKLQNELGHLGR